MKDLKHIVPENIEEFISKEDTPLVVINLDRVKQVLSDMKNALKKTGLKFEIYYALKASYLKPIIDILKNENIDGLEVMSTLEKKIANSAGFKNENIIYNGLYREKSDLINSHKENITINIDSLEELSYFKNEKDASVGLRIHPEFKEDGNFITHDSKLGLNYEEFFKALNVCKNHKIKLKGINFHIFSNITEHALVNKAIKETLKLIDYAEKYLGYEIEYLDVGGGIAPKFLFKNEKEFENFIIKSFYVIKKNKPNIKVILELGRYIVSDSTFVISKVKGIKTKKQKKWAVLDISSNYLIPAPGASYIVVPYNEKITDKGELIHFTDAIGSMKGIIDTNSYFVDLKKENLVIVTNCGAYTNSMKEQFIFETPKHIFLKNNKIENKIEKFNLNQVLEYYKWSENK